jgi:hypothetical protein
MRESALVTAVWLLSATSAPAQTTPSARAWDFRVSAYTYIIPDAANYVQPSLTADRDRWHFEWRYNYEAQKTGSLWIGWNFAGGNAIEWELTPIVGGVFGDLDGAATGYEGSIVWRKMNLYSESEYVIDTSDTSDRFLYNWSQLTYAITDSLRAGLAVQRTRAYQTNRDVQRGGIVEYSYRRVEFTLVLFNPDEDKPTLAFSVGFRF